MRNKDFFFNDTETTEIYTLSLHDALPIYSLMRSLSVSDNSAPIPDSLSVSNLMNGIISPNL